MKCPLKQRTEIEVGLIENGVVTASTERVYDFGECDTGCVRLVYISPTTKACNDALGNYGSPVNTVAVVQDDCK